MLLAVRAVATYELTAETFMLLMVEPPLEGTEPSGPGRAAVHDPDTLLRAASGCLRQPAAPPDRTAGAVLLRVHGHRRGRPELPPAARRRRAPAPGAARRGDDLRPPVPVLPVRPAHPDGPRRVPPRQAGRGAGAGDRRMGPAARRVSLRHDRRPDLGLRHGDRAGGRLPGLRPPGDRLLPGAEHPGPLCLGLCPGAGAARLPRLRAGLPGRGLAQRRCDVRGGAAGADPDRRGPGRRRRGDDDLVGAQHAHRAVRRGP